MADGEGEGKNISPIAEGRSTPKGAASVAPSAQSSGREGEPNLKPLLGIMFVRCCVCGIALPSEPVAIDDPANGRVSHGYCEPCGVQFTREAYAIMNPHVDTEDREEPEELLPPRTSAEFAALQRPAGGW